MIKKTSSMDTDAIKTKVTYRLFLTSMTQIVLAILFSKLHNSPPFQLSGFGFGLLEGIDPIADNFVGAGIIHTVAQQIGCLLRFEPNKQVQVGAGGVDGCGLGVVWIGWLSAVWISWLGRLVG